MVIVLLLLQFSCRSCRRIELKLKISAGSAPVSDEGLPVCQESVAFFAQATPMWASRRSWCHNTVAACRLLPNVILLPKMS